MKAHKSALVYFGYIKALMFQNGGRAWELFQNKPS